MIDAHGRIPQHVETYARDRIASEPDTINDIQRIMKIDTAPSTYKFEGGFRPSQSEH